MTNQIRKSGTERREEIALAILRIIGEKGLTSLTTATIAAEVGVSSGALFRHFASREEMLQATVEHALRKIEMTFPDESLPPLERLLELASSRVRLLDANPGIAWLLKSDQAYLELPAKAVQQLVGLAKRSRTVVLGAIREGAVQGSIRNDIAPEVLIVTVVGTIHALTGLSSTNRPSTLRKKPDPEHVLAGLGLMLAAPNPRI
jgi:AcrR family transcriptional regulator